MTTLANGVTTRRDGGGDGWAKAHRSHRELSKRYLMTDVDGYFGAMYWARNTSDTLFAEYADDQPTDSVEIMRRCALVALFDRKKSRDAVKDNKEVKVQTAFLLWLCRSLKTHQTSPPRFFYVFGDSEGPWELVEISIMNGKEIRSAEITTENMKDVWDRIGLSELRNSLRLLLRRDEAS